MNRIMILAVAALVTVAGMTVTQEANAGLFNRNKCCKTQKCSKPKRCRKRRAKKCCKQTCCAPAPSCGCAAPAAAPCGCAAAAPAPCGCEVASTCGCETTNCNCLSKRKLRRANRKGKCCGAKANSCNTCSAPVSTCGCESAAPAGCSSCGGGATVIESAPAEAAPEAPESTT